MLLAGSVSLDAVLERLALLRPVFHSEADFQQAFAWEVHSIDPSLRVRLETLSMAMSRSPLVASWKSPPRGCWFI